MTAVFERLPFDLPTKSIVVAAALMLLVGGWQYPQFFSPALPGSAAAERGISGDRCRGRHGRDPAWTDRFVGSVDHGRRGNGGDRRCWRKPGGHRLRKGTARRSCRRAGRRSDQRIWCGVYAHTVHDMDPCDQQRSEGYPGLFQRLLCFEQPAFATYVTFGFRAIVRHPECRVRLDCGFRSR